MSFESVKPELEKAVLNLANLIDEKDSAQRRARENIAWAEDLEGRARRCAIPAREKRDKAELLMTKCRELDAEIADAMAALKELIK